MVVQLKVMGETGQGNCLHLTIELNLEWNKIAGLDFESKGDGLNLQGDELVGFDLVGWLINQQCSSICGANNVGIAAVFDP